jgi:hypothetical protein
MQASIEAFQRELRRAREFNRGDILRATASFSCEEAKCPVSLVKIGFAEEMGMTKPMQWPLRCPRCMAPLARYVGLEAGR